MGTREVTAEDIAPAGFHDLEDRGSIPGRDVVGQALGVRKVSLGRLHRVVQEHALEFSGDIGRQGCVKQLQRLTDAIIIGNRHEYLN